MLQQSCTRRELINLSQVIMMDHSLACSPNVETQRERERGAMNRITFNYCQDCLQNCYLQLLHISRMDDISYHLCHPEHSGHNVYLCILSPFIVYMFFVNACMLHCTFRHLWTFYVVYKTELLHMYTLSARWMTNSPHHLNHRQDASHNVSFVYWPLFDGAAFIFLPIDVRLYMASKVDRALKTTLANFECLRIALQTLWMFPCFRSCGLLHVKIVCFWRFACHIAFLNVHLL